MNKYLNRQQRDYYYTAAIFGEILPQIKCFNNEAYNEQIDIATKHVLQAVEIIANLLDKKERERMLVESKKMAFFLGYKTEIKAEMEKRKRDESYYAIQKSKLYDLAEHCIEGACKTCGGKKECDIRTTFLELELDPLSESGSCPYAYE